VADPPSRIDDGSFRGRCAIRVAADGRRWGGCRLAARSLPFGKGFGSLSERHRRRVISWVTRLHDGLKAGGGDGEPRASRRPWPMPARKPLDEDSGAPFWRLSMMVLITVERSGRGTVSRPQRPQFCSWSLVFV